MCWSFVYKTFASILGSAPPPRLESATAMKIRPVWETTGADSAQTAPGPELERFGATETACSELLVVLHDAAAHVGADVGAVTGTLDSARQDLSAGCVLARAGYSKQAYTLWRSWYEQTLFSTYFLEAPLHREAWPSLDEIKHGEEPRSKLMLHELLNTSGTKHPFAVAYEARFDSMYQALKLSNVPKSSHPIALAKACLIDLSQGVHGTYQPRRVENAAALPTQLAKHATPVLEKTHLVSSLFVFAYVLANVGFDEMTLLRLRQAGASTSDDSERIALQLLTHVERWVTLTRDAAKRNTRG